MHLHGLPKYLQFTHSTSKILVQWEGLAAQDTEVQPRCLVAGSSQSTQWTQPSGINSLKSLSRGSLKHKAKHLALGVVAEESLICFHEQGPVQQYLQLTLELSTSPTQRIQGR